MKRQQLTLFGNEPAKNHHKTAKPALKNKRKYSMKHWSYRQRLIHHVTQSKSLTYKKMDWMATHEPLIKKLLKQYFIDQERKREPRPISQIHQFAKTVDRKRLNQAVHAMYLRKHGKYKLSINKICQRFKISKPSLYRGYKRKYGK